MLIPTALSSTVRSKGRARRSTAGLGLAWVLLFAGSAQAGGGEYETCGDGVCKWEYESCGMPFECESDCGIACGNLDPSGLAQSRTAELQLQESWSRTWQSSTFYASEDAWIWEKYPNSNYGTANHGQTRVSTGNNNRMTYLRFNLAGATPSFIGKAVLHIYVNNGSTTPEVKVYGVPDSKWDEGTLTWNNAPPLGAGGLIVTDLTVGAWNEIDVSELIGAGPDVYSGALRGGRDVTIAVTGHSGWTKFKSVEYDSGKRPYLTLEGAGAESCGDGICGGSLAEDCTSCAADCCGAQAIDAPSTSGSTATGGNVFVRYEALLYGDDTCNWACGLGCDPDACQWTYEMTLPEGHDQSQVYAGFICRTHPICREHDDCYDACGHPEEDDADGNRLYPDGHPEWIRRMQCRHSQAALAIDIPVAEALYCEVNFLFGLIHFSGHELFPTGYAGLGSCEELAHKAVATGYKPRGNHAVDLCWCEGGDPQRVGDPGQPGAWMGLPTNHHDRNAWKPAGSFTGSGPFTIKTKLSPHLPLTLTDNSCDRAAANAAADIPLVKALGEGTAVGDGVVYIPYYPRGQCQDRCHPDVSPRLCLSQHEYQECGNFDADPCYEYGPVQSCIFEQMHCQEHPPGCVLDPNACGNSMCQPEEGESCLTCPTDCGTCGGGECSCEGLPCGVLDTCGVEECCLGSGCTVSEDPEGPCEELNACGDEVQNKPDGTSCGNSGETCQNGICESSGLRADGDGCSDNSQCNSNNCDPTGVCCTPGVTCPHDVCGNGVCEASEDCETCWQDCGVCQACECQSGPCCDGCNFLSSSTQCRADAGDCDVAEYCSGNSGQCPADGFEPPGTLCGGGACEPGGTCGAAADLTVQTVGPAPGVIVSTPFGTCHTNAAANCSYTVLPGSVTLSVTGVAHGDFCGWNSPTACVGQGTSCTFSLSGAMTAEVQNAATGECP